jgi:hypothetical protein
VTKLQKSLMVAAGLVLAACLAVCVKSTVELQAARRELGSLTSANDFLRKTLGEMAKAITAKDKQIDRLENGDCNGHDKLPRDAPAVPRRSKASGAGAVGD